MASKHPPATAFVRLLAKCTDWISFLWVQAGLTFLILLLINVLAGMFTRAINHSHKTPGMEQTYGNAPWAAEYFKTLRHHEVRWFPYCYWKSDPVSSAYLNVDAQGDRVTWNRPNSKGRPFRIFMFGGSTMWGTGVRDEATLASMVSRRLTDAGQRVEVTNYGQIGYVSTQEVMLLFQLLRDGRRPDLVVFYDGINDSYAAYQNRIAGLTQNEFDRVQEFNLLSSARGRTTLYRTAANSIFMHSNIARLGRLFDHKTEESAADPRRVVAYLAPSDSLEEPAALQQQVISSYLFNKRVVEMFGREFGFESIFYWQPLIYSKNQLAAYEQSQLGDARRRDFMMGVYRLIGGMPPGKGVRDLSSIFRDHKELIYIDTWHPNEAGNQIIAQRMADDIAADIVQVTPSRQQPAKEHGATP
jgi:lysophospholipase L1-like esterase